jgi:hypothetical protein
MCVKFSEFGHGVRVLDRPGECGPGQVAVADRASPRGRQASVSAQQTGTATARTLGDRRTIGRVPSPDYDNAMMSLQLQCNDTTCLRWAKGRRTFNVFLQILWAALVVFGVLTQVGTIVIVLRGCMFERRDAAGVWFQVPGSKGTSVGHSTLIVSRLSNCLNHSQGPFRQR